jgi:hypothetical protein
MKPITLLITCVLVACGGDSETKDTADTSTNSTITDTSTTDTVDTSSTTTVEITTCAEALEAVCTAACACSEDCGWQTTGGWRVSSVPNGVDWCVEYSMDKCDGQDSDFAACEVSVDQAECIDQSGTSTLMLTEECDDLD